MKNIISIIVISLLLSANVSADNNKNISATSDQPNLEVAASDSSKTIVPAEKKSAGQVAQDETVIMEEDGTGADILSVISLIVSILALGMGIFAYVSLNSKCASLKGRYNKVDAALAGFNQRTDLKLRDIRNEIVKQEQLKNEILEDVSFMIRKFEEDMKTKTFSVVKIAEEPQFTSKVFYGVFKSRFNGVHSDQMTEVQEGTSTMVITTKTDDTASVSLVRNLDKVQFGNLNENALEVLEGNPLSYTNITEVEAGQMRLEDDIWVLVKKIRVKLS